MMSFRMHTFDIQDIVIALIFASVREENPDMKARMEKMIDVFADVNRACAKENDYTVTVTVEA